MSTNRMMVMAAAVLGVMALSVTPARARNTQSKQQAPSFSKLDRNHDGHLTRREVPHDMHKLRREFRTFDRDGNGWLSKREYQAYAHPAEFRKLP